MAIDVCIKRIADYFMLVSAETGEVIGSQTSVIIDNSVDSMTKITVSFDVEPKESEYKE